MVSEYCYSLLLFIHVFIDDYLHKGRVTKYHKYSVRLHLSQNVNCIAGMSVKGEMEAL
jgi:hypothetical protein